MRIAIVGCGALGLYYGALLQKSGEDVHFLARRDHAALVSGGLKVFSINGDFELPQVKAYLNPDEIGPVDLVLVGLKTFANGALDGLIRPLLGTDSRILTLQNGLGNEETLAGLFGPERILGGVAFLCSNRGEPGVVHHLGAGRIVIGEYHTCAIDRLEQLAAMFVRAGVDCRTTADLKRARWEKLVWNIPFNGLCALLQQPVNRLLEVPATRRLVHGIMLEVIAAANAQGLSSPIAVEYAGSMLKFTDSMGEYRPSMQIDREQRRQLEIEAILDKALELGQERGVAMPLTGMLATLLRQVCC